MTNDRRIDKLGHSHMMKSCTLLVNELELHASTWMKLTTQRRSEIRVSEEYILLESIDLKFITCEIKLNSV